MAVIFVADIGGTNCRLGLFRHDGETLAMDKAAWVETGSISHADALMAAFERELEGSVDTADMVVVAIAGPVEDLTAGCLSNGMLRLDFAPLNREKMKYFLINDFMAQAYAVLSPQGERAKRIAGPDVRVRDTVRAVIGAGTGLGQAMLVLLAASADHETSRWLAIPSENGHSAFPFVNGAENDFHTFLRHKLHLPFATGDDTVTGRGLAVLHEFLTGEQLTPAQVGGQALSHDTSTLQWYARFYGRVCRDWILSTMCEGGLWIAGGIAAQNPLAVTSRYFTDELYNAPGGEAGWSRYLKNVPVFLLEDTNSGLWGAARFGQQKLDL